MFNGTCPKCNQSDVRERRAELPGSPDQVATLHMRLFVCVACGYTETYTHAEDLSMIAQSAYWRIVPPTNRPSNHPPVTGATVRLEAPPNDEQHHPPTSDRSRSPKKRCPACQSQRLVPGVRIVDHNQALARNLTVEVDRNPDALMFRGTMPSDLRAWICSECGYTSIFADRPSELFAAYQASKR